VEDWELFFQEKSRRRADETKRRARVRVLKAGMAVAFVAAAAAGASFFIS
jgi:hypothetical protein